MAKTKTRTATEASAAAAVAVAVGFAFNGALVPAAVAAVVGVALFGVYEYFGFAGAEITEAQIRELAETVDEQVDSIRQEEER